MSDSRARVGIVVRTRNRPWFLRRALSDISGQDYTDWEVHIVNDGGDAEAVDAVVAELADVTRRRTAVTHHATSRGRSAAANAGMAAVAGDLVVLHDDDDLWHPEFLSRTVEWLDGHDDYAGVVARTEIVYEESEAGGGFAETGRAIFWADMNEISYVDLLEINRWVPIAFLYRRDLHDAIGMYREDLHAAEDWDFNLRATVGHRLGFIAEPVLAYWMQRTDVAGEAGNSMFVLAEEHARFDRYIRDTALRDYAARHGSGLPLFLTQYVKDTVREVVRDVVREVVREEISGQLDARPTDGQRIARRLRRLLRRDR